MIRDSVRQRFREFLPLIQHCFVLGWSAPPTDKTDVLQDLKSGLGNCRLFGILDKAEHCAVTSKMANLETNYKEVFGNTPDRDHWDWDGMRHGPMPLWEKFLTL